MQANHIMPRARRLRFKGCRRDPFRSGRNNRIASNSVMRRCPLHDRSSTESGSQLAMLRCLPITDICSVANCSLFDYLVGGGEQGRRHGEAQRLGGDEIDDKIELGWLLDRNVARLGAA
jgi:hypothetical protein